MDHLERGQKAKLGMEKRGDIFITLEVLNVALGTSAHIRFLIDTGFNGFLQMTETQVQILGLSIHDSATTTLSDGRTLETGITTTTLRIFDRELSDFPIQVVPNGLSLIGTQLLRKTNTMLLFDYEDGYVSLTQEPEIKETIKREVETRA